MQHNEKPTIKLTIKLAGLTPMPLEAKDMAEKELYLRAEESVNTLWATRSSQFKSISSEHVLAMVAFEFAINYLRELRKDDDLRELDRVLDKLLHGQTPTADTTDGSK